MKRRPGLTLLELVVVLAILATLALVAVLMTEGTLDQARYDATRRTLENIETATLGPVSTTPGQTPACFIADVGRPPQAVDADPTSGLQLAELWDIQSLRPYGPATTSDPAIVVYSGWRGPYLRVPASSTTTVPRLLDGWGNPFQSLAADDTTVIATTGTPIARVRSLGGASPPYSQPMTSMRSFKDWTGVVNGSLVDGQPSSPATMTTEVRLIVPDGTLTAGVREYARTFAADGTDTSNAAGTARDGFQFVFPDPTHYPAESGITLPFGSKVLKISQSGATRSVIHFTLPVGSLTLTERPDLQ